MVRSTNVAVLLCLVAGHAACAQDAPSARELAWAKTVTRAIGREGVTVAPTKADGRIVVTYDDTRVTRKLAASPESALEHARTLLTRSGEGAQLIEVRGRQVVLVEAMRVAHERLPAILESAWGVLPGADAHRTALGLRRGDGLVVLALGDGPLRTEAFRRRDSFSGPGAYRVRHTVVLQEANRVQAAWVGPYESAFASAANSTELRELLAQFARLAPHGLELDKARSAPTSAGDGRGAVSDVTVTEEKQAPTERPDLTGAWSVHDRDDGPMAEGSSPDMVRLSNRVTGEPDRYEIVFLTAAGQTSGRATFDGETLVVETVPAAVPATPVSVGFIRVIESTTTGKPVRRPTADPARAQARAQEAPRSLGRYTLRTSARELEFTVVGSEAPAGDAPVHAFRRLAEPTVTCPGEWEASDEILWAAGSGVREFALVGVYAAALRSTSGVTHRIFATSSADELFLDTELAAALGEAQLDKLDALEVVVRRVARGSVWIRDFGPITVRRKSDGARVAGDTGYHSNRPEDDALPREYAASRGWDVVDVERLKFEGGNFMSDGRGKIYVTSRTVEGRYTGANDSQRAVEDALFELGAREVCWIPRMTHADGTGHIDMFSKLLDADSVLVGRDTGGPHAAMLEQAAARYAALGLRVERVEMADNPTVDARARDLQTYTNALFIGRVALVPQYDSPETDRAALEVYRRAGYTAVGADVRAVIGANGAIHCVSMQIPR